MAEVSIGSNSIVNADNAVTIMLNGSDSDDAVTLSKTLQYIYTTVQDNIYAQSLKQENHTNFDIFYLYGIGLTVYEFVNFLQSRGYIVTFKEIDGSTTVEGQFENDADIKADLYNKDTNVHGIKFVDVDWTTIGPTSDYVITIAEPSTSLPPYEGEVEYPT